MNVKAASQFWTANSTLFYLGFPLDDSSSKNMTIGDNNNNNQ